MNTIRIDVITPITIVLACLAMSFTGCKKDVVKAPTSYTMYVVNGGINSKLQTNFTNNGVVTQNARGQYFVISDQTVSIADTTALSSPLINKSFGYNKGVYSIFVTGQSPTFETIFKAEDDLPFIPNDKNYTSADSVVNVRFINLSPNSVPLKIKFSTAATNEAEQFAYKQITAWRSWKATATTTNYVLEIRDWNTNALITTYTFVANATNRFKNVTLMIRGLQGITTGTNAFGVTPINYF